MNNYIYSSVLKEEFNSYLAIKAEQGYKYKNRYCLESLDQYLVKNNHMEKSIPISLIETWMAEINTNLASRSVETYITYYNGFAKYLSSIGICAFTIEYPLGTSVYTAYIFSQSEIDEIISVADNGKSSKDKLTKIQFPMLLRILLGCGLRVSEALKLRLADVDINSGTLLIIDAKGHKDRIVPMHPSLTDILEKYCRVLFAGRNDNPFLFESNYRDGRRNCIGKPRNNTWVDHNFRRCLLKAEIEQRPYSNQRRGLCPHCLRHTFAVHSYRKQEREGISQYRALPLISLYLGHESLLETQAYIHMTSEISEDIVYHAATKFKGVFPEVPI